MYPYGKRDYYPHLMPEDVKVWERFIAANPDAYDTAEYDVPVGTVPDFVAQGTPEGHGKMDKLYQRKIDVVGHKGTNLDIIECKPICSMSTIGQIKGYVYLYNRDYKPQTPPGALVICGSADRDVLEHAKEEGIRVAVV